MANASRESSGSRRPPPQGLPGWLAVTVFTAAMVDVLVMAFWNFEVIERRPGLLVFCLLYLIVVADLQLKKRHLAWTLTRAEGGSNRSAY